MFDTRGKPGFHRFPFKIGDDVCLKTGSFKMKVVDFDEAGLMTVSWYAHNGMVSEMIAHHTLFLHWADAVQE